MHTELPCMQTVINQHNIRISSSISLTKNNNQAQHNNKVGANVNKNEYRKYVWLGGENTSKIIRSNLD